QEGQNFPLFWLERYLGKRGGLGGGFSVATVAFELAKLMGCEPVVLIGQDLSFPTGMTHAEGTAFCTKVNLNAPDFFKVPS
ncbi:MAG: hypothetical protein COS84_04395, partial [Armatimonadetes bacterium CG07_land_8_20_14_0_80_40_9]